MDLLKHFKTDDVETILENFLEQDSPTPYEVQLILKLLAEIGVDKVHAQANVICPETKVAVTTPCSLDKCHFHINFPTAANCLLVYMDQQKNGNYDSMEAVSLVDQTYLYNKSFYELKKIYKRANLKIKGHLFRQWASERGMALFDFWPTLKVCCCCESRIDGRAYITYNKEFVYCSEECYAELPPKKLDLEVLFGLAHDQLPTYLPKCFGPTAVELLR